MTLLAGDLERFIGCDEGDFVMAGAPGELLDAGGGFGDLPGVATGHGHDENLRFAFGGGEEGEAHAVGGPAGLGEAAAIVAEDALGVGGDGDEDELGVVAVLFVVGAGDD